MIGHQQEAPALGLYLVHDGAPFSDRSQKFLSVLLRIAGERALGDPLLQHLGKRGSRFNVGRRQLVTCCNIARCRLQPLRSVEHAQPLGHAVDGSAHLLIFPILISGEDGAGHAHRKLSSERGEQRCEDCFRKGRDDCRRPAGSKDGRRVKAARKHGEPDKHDQP